MERAMHDSQLEAIMRIQQILLVAAFAGALGAACGPVAVHGRVYAPTPQLAYVGPDLYVVADYGAPVFYTNNYYWLFYDGFWYRSSYFDRGWIVAVAVPDVVAHIDRPHRYIHYRGGPYYAPGPGSRDHRRPYVRPVPMGNRVPPRPPPPPARPAPRDHRR
jgi:hypothetical protein